MIYLLSLLLISNLFLSHGYRIKQFYFWVLRKIFKPKFRSGEIVIINGEPYEIRALMGYERPYTYYCLPVFIKNVNLLNDPYFHESKIKKITGLLKELE